MHWDSGAVSMLLIIYLLTGFKPRLQKPEPASASGSGQQNVADKKAFTL